LDDVGIVTNYWLSVNQKLALVAGFWLTEKLLSDTLMRLANGQFLTLITLIVILNLTQRGNFL
jgi:hypothetical protein